MFALTSNLSVVKTIPGCYSLIQYLHSIQNNRNKGRNEVRKRVKNLVSKILRGTSACIKPTCSILFLDQDTGVSAFHLLRLELSQLPLYGNILTTYYT